MGIPSFSYLPKRSALIHSPHTWRPAGFFPLHGLGADPSTELATVPPTADGPIGFGGTLEGCPAPATEKQAEI